MDSKRMMIKRICMTSIGVFLCAFSVGMFNLAAFGVDPMQCFAQGIHLPFASMITYGSFWLILSGVLLVIDLFVARRYVGIGTLVIFGTGYVVDWSFDLLSKLFPSPDVLTRILMLIAALIVMCFASSLYFTGDLGVSVYDAIPLSLADKKPRVFGRVVPFRFVRIFCDCVCVIIGFLFGKVPGVGTIMTGFCMGPLITFFNVHVSEPLLYGRAQAKREG